MQTFSLIYRYLIVFILVFISCNQAAKKELPIYNPADVNPKLVAKSVRHINSNHKVADFKLQNQNGTTVTQKDYENKVYVVDFFFTSCTSICPIMTTNMAKIQDEFMSSDTFMLLSVSVTPEFDTVEILKAYADKKGVQDAKWNVTTGVKKHIYELARKSYFAVSEQGDGGLQDFIHTPNFILVDSEKQIRGIYDGTDKGAVSQVITDIKILLNKRNP